MYVRTSYVRYIVILPNACKLSYAQLCVENCWFVIYSAVIVYNWFCVVTSGRGWCREGRAMHWVTKFTREKNCLVGNTTFSRQKTRYLDQRSYQQSQTCWAALHHRIRFTALFLGPPGWPGARRELLDFMVQGKINKGRDTDNPDGRHSIGTNQCPPPPSPIFLTCQMPFCRPTNSIKALRASSIAVH